MGNGGSRRAFKANCSVGASRCAPGRGSIGGLLSNRALRGENTVTLEVMSYAMPTRCQVGVMLKQTTRNIVAFAAKKVWQPVAYGTTTTGVEISSSQVASGAGNSTEPTLNSRKMWVIASMEGMV